MPRFSTTDTACSAIAPPGFASAARAIVFL